MELKELIQVYRVGWKAVVKVQKEESRSASLELRWQQLNAAYGLAKGSGLLRPDPTEVALLSPTLFLS